MRRIMIVLGVILISSGIWTRVVSGGGKNPAIAQLITQQTQEAVTAGVAEDTGPVTVDGELYLIFVLKNRIDPITCEVVPNSAPTKVYVDTKHYPVSEIGIARKIEVIDYVQQLQKGELQRAQLIKKIETLQKAQRKIPDFNVRDASLDATIKLVSLINVPKTIVKGILRLIEGVAGKVFRETLFSTMQKLRDRTFEDFSQAIDSYLNILKEIRESQSIKVEDYDIAKKILDEYHLAKNKEKTALLLAKKIYDKSDYDAAEIIGDRLLNDLSIGFTDEVIARHIEIDLIEAEVTQFGIPYKVALYTQKLAEGCGKDVIVSDISWPMVRHDSQHTGRSPYLGPERPSLKWKMRSSNCRWVAIAKEGTIYGEFSSEFGGGTQLCAINPDGRLKWKSEVGYAPLGIVDTGVIYVSGDWKSGDSSVFDRPTLWGISPKGTIQLEKEIDAPPAPKDVTKRIATNSLVIGNDGTIYSVLGDRKSAILYSFTENGSLNWKFLFAPVEFGHPLPAVYKDGTIYLVSKEKESCFLNAITPDGKPKWREEIGKSILAHYDFPQLVIGDDGTIYLVVVGDFLCAISPDGSLRWKKWRINEGSFSTCSLPAIGVDGTIYISTALISPNNSPCHKVIAFDSDGQFRWSSVPLREVRTPLTVDSNGTVYFVDNQGIVHALNREGILKWRFPTDQPANAYLSGGTIAIGKNGVLYFLGGFTCWPQSQYGYLYAIGEAE